MTKRDVLKLGMALAAGAAGAGLIVLLTRKELQEELETSGAELRRRLARSGTRLQREVRSAAEDAAREAVRLEMRRLGITDSLVRDTSRTVARLNQLVASFT